MDLDIAIDVVFNMLFPRSHVITRFSFPLGLNLKRSARKTRINV